MKGNEIVHKILNQYQLEDIDFDVYIIADTQKQTVSKSDPRIHHANESEFFSRREFAEIASALFNVFGFAKVFYSEIEFIEYIIQHKITAKECIVYNFSRDGLRAGKKSLIPAFCDLYGIKYTGSNAFVISLLRNKWIFSSVLSQNGVSVPISCTFAFGRTSQTQILEVLGGKEILIKNIDESSSIGMKPSCRMTLNQSNYQQFCNVASEVNPSQVLVQEFIDGAECEVLVVKYKGSYFALDPVEIVLPYGQSFMDSGISNNYNYSFKLLDESMSEPVRQAAVKAAEVLGIKDYARFDFRIQEKTPYLFDIAGTPYTIRHSSIAYLFAQYGLEYEDIYKMIVTCMLSHYRGNQL